MRIATYRLRHRKSGREIVVNKQDYHADLSRYSNYERIGEARGDFDEPLSVAQVEQPGSSEQPEPVREKPLSQCNKAELLATAADEGVEVPDGATNKEIIAAIQDAREAAGGDVDPDE